MNSITIPIGELLGIANSHRYIADRINWDVLDFFGVFVLKNAFRPETIKKYSDSYFGSLRRAELHRTQFHLTEVKIPEDHFLRQITQENELVDAVLTFFGGKVGASYIRIVKKDKDDAKPVFLHQDTGYQIGSFDRYSLFIPLTPCNYQNGGLVLYPGTHNFGYLGDVGEIIDILPIEYPRLKTNVAPGDILVMHSATWHQSPPNLDFEDRVYIEVNVQHLDDPTTSIPVCGERHAKWQLNVTPDEILRNSRTQRIRSMYKEIEALQANAARAVSPPT